MIASIEGIEIEFCKGILLKCRNSLSSLPDLIENTLPILKSSSWHKKFLKKDKIVQKHHLLKIGISACPNSCAKSQIKDLGLILRSKIEYNNTLCNLCLSCVKTCRENAILYEDEIILKKGVCVGCSKCVNTCTTNALTISNTYFDVLVGGRLGRHPRFGTKILEIPPTEIYNFLTYFMKFFDDYPHLVSAKELFEYISFSDIRDGFLKR